MQNISTPAAGESAAIEVVETSALDTIERAQIDIQIATAKKYPRKIGEVKQTMISYATLDQATAEGCFYVLPGRKGGDNKPIMGPSVRLAEIAVASYQHLRAGMRVIANDGKFITAQGFCHDLQNNVSIAMEVKRRITKRDGSTYSDDMQAVAGMAACSIAFRNAVFKVVPMALIRPVYQEALKTAAGDAKTIAARRVEAVQRFIKEFNVDKAKVFVSVGVKTIDDIGVPELEMLIGFYNAIKEGETTVADVFEPQADETKKPATGAGLKAVDQVETPAPAPVVTPAPVVEPKAEGAKDDPKLVKIAVNTLEGLALDLDLSLSKLFDLAAADGSERAAKLTDLPLAKLNAMIAELRASKK